MGQDVAPAQVLKKYKTVDKDDKPEVFGEPDFVDTTKFNLIIGLFILINALFIGLETDLGPEDSTISKRLFWYIMDNIFVTIFFMEMIARFYYAGMTYFNSGWNCLDFFL